MRFSQRHGYRELREVFQLESLDLNTRVSLWNVFLIVLEPYKNIYRISEDQFTENYVIRTYLIFFKRPIDQCPTRWDDFLGELKHVLLSYGWYDVLDFLEHSYERFNDKLSSSFAAAINSILEKECVGCRFVAGKISPHTSDTEISEIQNAMKNTRSNVSEHLNAALYKLSDRNAPDYRNSIKESISAVEAHCRVISQDPNITLNKSLRTLENKNNLHPLLKNAFSSLYNYTSDSGGIRHALKDDISPGQPEAQFFLVACSAFINYLTVRYTLE